MLLFFGFFFNISGTKAAFLLVCILAQIKRNFSVNQFWCFCLQLNYSVKTCVKMSSGDPDALLRQVSEDLFAGEEEVLDVSHIVSLIFQP